MMKCIKNRVRLAFLLLAEIPFWNPTHAALPFESIPPVPCQSHPMVAGLLGPNQVYGGACTIFEPGNGDTLSIWFLVERGRDSSNIQVYRNHRLLQTINDPVEFTPLTLPDSLWVADLNNDTRIDIKALVPTAGCGLAASLLRKIYLVGKPGGTFGKFAFTDFSDQPERDFNRDGTFEIIGVGHLSYQNHSYWVYDLFTLENGTLQNVSTRYGYPILIQHLNRYNDAITRRIARADMFRFSIQRPDSYDEKP